ncbi:MAG: protein-disulfide reductase DsbD family protein [Pyrinomonadaceae bacterium]
MSRFFAAIFFAVSVCLTLAAGGHAQNPVSVSMTATPASIPAGGSGTARITASIEGGWYLYSITQPPGGPIQTRIALGEGPFKAGRISGPRPRVKMDPNFGMDTETYAGSAAFTIPFTVEPGTPEGPQTLNASIRFQACNDKVCLPPRTVRLTSAVTITAASASAAVTPSPTRSPTPTPSPTPAANVNANAAVDANTAANLDSNANAALPSADEPFFAPDTSLQPGQDGAPEANRTAESRIGDQPIWGFIWLAMTFGALSLLTPCVFPMIPITVSYFTKHGSETTAGSVRDALIYAAGIILTFTGLGVALAVLFGAAGINRFAANPYTNLLITAIFLAFAFSLLGAYNFGVPSGVLTKLDSMARSKDVGKTVALLLMGLTFSLTSFTCTVPLVGVILVAASQGELFYPIIGMLAFSAVFALPFFVLAIAPQLLQSLPRSGSWMNSVKVVMGFLEIGAALKFISNVDLVWGWDIFTREVVIAGWIALSILIFLYLLGVFRFSHDSEQRNIGLVRVLNAFLFGTLSFYLLTGLFGSRLGELESFLPPAKEVSAGSTAGSPMSGELTWITNDLEAAVARSKAENKRIFVDFTGYTCTNCRWMEANMFPKPAVRAELEKYVRVRLYTDGEGEPYEGFQKMQEQRFGTVALPLYALITPSNEVVATFEGLTRNEDEFLAFLRK